MRKLEVPTLEDINRKVIEAANLIRTRQDELEVIIQELERNKTEFGAGKIPEQAYKDNSMKYEEERKKLEREIATTCTNCHQHFNRAIEIINEQRPREETKKRRNIERKVKRK